MMSGRIKQKAVTRLGGQRFGLLFCLFSLLLATALFAFGGTKTTKVVSDLNGLDGSTWVQMTANSDTNFVFDLGGGSRGQDNPYDGGKMDVYVWIDTSLAGAGDNDSLWISIQPLVYDVVTSTFVASSHVTKDSVDVANDLDWGATDSRPKFDINVSVDLPPCDRVQLNVYALNNAQCRIRAELRITVKD